MSISAHRAKPGPPDAPGEYHGAIPALESGDHLTRDEFERRYDAMPHLKKAELIEGVVYVASPVRCEHHGEPHLTLGGWLFNYRARTPGLRGADNASVRLEVGNMPQTDCLLFVSPENGGRMRIDEDDYVNGGPDLVAEVAASSASNDSHEKLDAYQRNGVREYMVWRVLDAQIDGTFYAKQVMRSSLRRTTASCAVRSFPAYVWLDPAALLGDDFDRLLTVL